MKSLEGKKMLILGGIEPMIEVVNRAHELGIIVYVTDYYENSPAKKIADKSFMISVSDIDAVVDLIRKEHINGVYTGNAEVLLPFYVEICKRTGLPCYGTQENFEIMTNKKIFKNYCKKYDVPTIKEYKDSTNITEFPVLVKPIDSSGSRGISVCENANELSLGIDKALSYSACKEVLIEKYMTGDEVVLYYYFQDGNPVFAGMCDRYVFKQHGVAQLPTAYIFPSIYTRNHMQYTDTLVKNMFNGIGMTNGPIFLQAFIENGLPCIYEPGYRTNGAREQKIIGNITGVNSVNMLINFALTGKMSDSNIENNVDPLLKGKIACKLSPLIGKGRISRISGIETVKKMPNVVSLVLNNNVEDSIDNSNYGTLKQIGYRAYIIADTKEELKLAIDEVEQTINFYDENDESMMLPFFDSRIILERY